MKAHFTLLKGGFPLSEMIGEFVANSHRIRCKNFV